MILPRWLDDQLVGGSMSDVYQSLAHSKSDCKYHVVFVPKRRRKVIFGMAREGRAQATARQVKYPNIASTKVLQALNGCAGIIGRKREEVVWRRRRRDGERVSLAIEPSELTVLTAGPID